MRSVLHPLTADAIVGDGDRKKDKKCVYRTIGDADLVREIDKLTFDHGKTETWRTKEIVLLEMVALTQLQTINPVARTTGMVGYGDNDDCIGFRKIID